MEGGADTDTLQVNGSPTGGDQFLIQVNPRIHPFAFRSDQSRLFNLNIGTIEASISIPRLNDTLTVEFAGGNPIPSAGLTLSEAPRVIGSSSSVLRARLQRVRSITLEAGLAQAA